MLNCYNQQAVSYVSRLERSLVLQKRVIAKRKSIVVSPYFKWGEGIYLLVFFSVTNPSKKIFSFQINLAMT